MTIIIHSYKGGTGKTTFSIHLATVLSSQFEEIYLLETDFEMPSFHSLFPNTFKKVDKFSNDLYSKQSIMEELFYKSEDHKADNIYIGFSNPDFNPSDPLFGNNEQWFTKSLKFIIDQLTEFKVEHPNALLIIDTPPGYHFVVINNLLIADIAIIVIRPNKYAIDGTKRILKDIYERTRLSKDMKTYILFNQVPNINNFKELENWKNEISEMGYKILPDINYDDNTAYYSAKGLVVYPKDGNFYKKVSSICKRLYEE